jgi:hypothetical protein
MGEASRRSRPAGSAGNLSPRRSRRRSPPMGARSGVLLLLDETLMLCNPVPRFRLGPEATHRGRVGPWDGDLNTEVPLFQRNGAVGRLSVRVCHALYIGKPSGVVTTKSTRQRLRGVPTARDWELVRPALALSPGTDLAFHVVH